MRLVKHLDRFAYAQWNETVCTRKRLSGDSLQGGVRGSSRLMAREVPVAGNSRTPGSASRRARSGGSWVTAARVVGEPLGVEDGDAAPDEADKVLVGAVT